MIYKYMNHIYEVYESDYTGLESPLTVKSSATAVNWSNTDQKPVCCLRVILFAILLLF